MNKAVVDLEGAPRVPWNLPFKDKLVLKNLSDLAQWDPTHKAEKHAFFKYEIVGTTYLPKSLMVDRSHSNFFFLIRGAEV